MLLEQVGDGGAAFQHCNLERRCSRMRVVAFAEDGIFRVGSRLVNLHIWLRYQIPNHINVTIVAGCPQVGCSSLIFISVTAIALSI